MEFITYDEKMNLKESFNTITYRQSTTKNITVQENDHCIIYLPSFFNLASSHTDYPKAFRTVHNLIRKPHSNILKSW